MKFFNELHYLVMAFLFMLTFQSIPAFSQYAEQQPVRDSVPREKDLVIHLVAADSSSRLFIRFSTYLTDQQWNFSQNDIDKLLLRTDFKEVQLSFLTGISIGYQAMIKGQEVLVRVYNRAPQPVGIKQSRYLPDDPASLTTWNQALALFRQFPHTAIYFTQK